MILRCGFPVKRFRALLRNESEGAERDKKEREPERGDSRKGEGGAVGVRISRAEEDKNVQSEKGVYGCEDSVQNENPAADPSGQFHIRSMRRKKEV